MKLFRVLGLIFSLGALTLGTPAFASGLPTKEEIKSQINELKQADNPENKQKIQNLTQALEEMDNLSAQQKELAEAKKFIDDIPNLSTQIHSEINTHKDSKDKDKYQDFKHLTINDLQIKLNQIAVDLRTIQEDNAGINLKLAGQKNILNTATDSLQTNISKIQSNNKKLANLKDKEQGILIAIDTEILNLKNELLRLLLKNDSKIKSFYNLQIEGNKTHQACLEKQQLELQTLINNKKLAESKSQAEELAKLQNQEKSTSKLLDSELSFNIKLSQDIIAQTAQLNKLTQDDLRTKSILNNLQETQRNVNERINALQGTLVLSRIIDKQKNYLPKDKLINNLGKQITDLRVKIFDRSELRDQLYNPDQYLEDLSQEKPLTAEEKAQLKPILEERYKLVENEIELLNNQLNLLINIDVNQKQVEIISEELKSKLQEQSFWVQSNSVMDLTWFSQFFSKLFNELNLLRKDFCFTQNLSISFILPTLIAIILLVLVAKLIKWQRAFILEKLSFINSQIKSIKNDHQYYTPIALIITAILSIPSSFYFFSAVLVGSYFFKTPSIAWQWGFEMAIFLFFANFMLKILDPEPNSVGVRHYGFNAEVLEVVQVAIRRIFICIFLWLNANILNNIDGITNDVIGQLATIVILGFTLYYATPKIREAISVYVHKDSNSTTPNKEASLPILLKVILTLSFILPILFMILVIMGYYFTVLNLMHHFIYTYAVVIVWFIIRATVYRALYTFWRSFRYKQLLAKVAKNKEKGEIKESKGDDFATVEVEEKLLDISKLQGQILKIADLFLWLILGCGIYLVWVDLLAVATYLNNIELWEITKVGKNGAEVVENITLLNVLFALIFMFTTYVLVKNLSGILEILLFAHIKFAQGTAYTINTLLSYIIIVLGTTVTLASLGISWSKLQWVLTAFSVGLGFGLQEIFANFVSGIIILFERPVRVGDVVTIGNFTGTVSKIRIRSTTLMDFDRKEIVVPNKAFVTEQIVNWALSNPITRVKICIGVAYGSDLRLVKEILFKIADECPYVLKDPKPLVFFLNFGASTLDHELRIYVNDVLHRNRAIDYINNRIDEEFSKHNIEIAFNQMDVYIKNVNADQAIQTQSNPSKVKSVLNALSGNGGNSGNNSNNLIINDN